MSGVIVYYVKPASSENAFFVAVE